MRNKERGINLVLITDYNFRTIYTLNLGGKRDCNEFNNQHFYYDVQYMLLLMMVTKRKGEFS